MSKNKNDQEATYTVEVDALRRLCHPNIIKIEDFFQTEDVFVIVLELAQGGELFEYILEDFNKKTFDETVAKVQFYQILSGVQVR